MALEKRNRTEAMDEDDHAPDDAPLAPSIETPLDLAFERARADEEETAGFYDALFAATVFLPIDRAFDDDGNESAEAASAIEPVFYEVEGEATLLIFDTEERLARWTDEPVDYVGLTGRQLFEMFDGGQQVALNIGVAPSSVVIPSEMAAWLHERAREAGESEEIGAGVALDVMPPPDLDTEIVARIAARIAGLRREVDEAVFFSLGIDAGQEEAERRVVLGVAASQEGMRDAGAVAEALAETARGAFDGARPVEVALLSASSPLMEKARKVGLNLPVVQVGSIH